MHFSLPLRGASSHPWVPLPVALTQVFWFYKIVQIARRGSKAGDKEAGKQD